MDPQTKIKNAKKINDYSNKNRSEHTKLSYTYNICSIYSSKTKQNKKQSISSLRNRTRKSTNENQKQSRLMYYKRECELTPKYLRVEFRTSKMVWKH